jgi:diacylglycerol kinase
MVVTPRRGLALYDVPLLRLPLPSILSWLMSSFLFLKQKYQWKFFFIITFIMFSVESINAAAAGSH